MKTAPNTWRWVSACLILLFAGASVVSAGGTEESEAATAESQTPGTMEGYTLPLTTTDESLSIATQENSVDTYLEEGLPVFEEIKEQTGVQIEWEASWAEWWEPIEIRLAAGVNLPDIVRIPNGQDPIHWYRQDVIISLTELIDSYAPNIKDWLYFREPRARKMMSATDGNIVALPAVVKEDDGAAVDRYHSQCMIVRYDWLEKLGLEEPQTLDDFYEMLVAFKTQDPNGNGQADEIPWTPNVVSANGGISWMFGLHLTKNGGFYPNESDQVEYEYIEPRMKEYLAFMNRLYEEELLDREFATNSWDDFMSKFYNGISGSTWFLTMVPAVLWNAPLQNNTGNPNALYMPILTPEGPNGDAITEANSTGASGGFFAITKDCENPELAIKWLDYASFSPEAVMWNEYGVEGLTYEMVDGAPQYIDEVVNSDIGFTNEMFKIGALHYAIPQILTEGGRSAIFSNAKDIWPRAKEIYETAEPVFVTALPTADESREINSKMADINTFVQEQVVKFIRGDRPLDEFDDFTSTLKSMGIDEVIEIKQAQYERFLES